MLNLLPPEQRSSLVKNPFLLIEKEEFEKLIHAGKTLFPENHKQHFLKSLRFTKEQTFWVGDGNGRLLQTIFDGNFLVGEKDVYKFDRKIHFEIYQANIKPKYLDYVVQKCSELAVAKIKIFQSDFSQPYGVKTQRLEEIALMAAMQAKCIYKTEVLFVAERLEEIENQSDKKFYFGDFFSDNTAFDNEHKCVFVNGPEGGWSNREQQFLKKGFLSIKLCDSVLRSDTAAVAAATLIANSVA